MTASAEVVTDVREDCLGVPIQSVTVRTLDQLGIGKADAATRRASGEPRFDPDDDGFVEVVWVVDGGHAVRSSGGDRHSDRRPHIEITGGLSEGDQVVVGSYRAISRDLADG